MSQNTKPIDLYEDCNLAGLVLTARVDGLLDGETVLS